MVFVVDPYTDRDTGRGGLYRLHGGRPSVPCMPQICHKYVVVKCRGVWYTVYLYFCAPLVCLVWGLAKSRVTDKFQVTIPKEVREAVGLKPGEVVVVEKVSEEEIVLRRFKRVKDPLKVLVGKKPFPRHVPLEELEEKMEAR